MKYLIHEGDLYSFTRRGYLKYLQQAATGQWTSIDDYGTCEGPMTDDTHFTPDNYFELYQVEKMKD